MGKSNCPGQSKPEKICGTCRYFNPEFPVNGKPAPVCLAIKEMKGGTEYSNPRGTQHYFRCSNGRYEIGISNLGVRVLYDLVNKQPDYMADRVYAPEADFQPEILYALESKKYIKDFDAVGFSLQYEMAFPTVLKMLETAQIP